MTAVQSTLPKSNSHKSNNCLSRRSIQVLFSLYSIVLTPHKVKFSLSPSYFFSPNRFDLSRVDCIFIVTLVAKVNYACPKISKFDICRIAVKHLYNSFMTEKINYLRTCNATLIAIAM